MQKSIEFKKVIYFLVELIAIEAANCALKTLSKGGIFIVGM